MTSDAAGGRLAAWRQLLRIANVFTAASNVIAGFLIARGAWSPPAVLATLVAAAMLMYAAGMVLNDAFDADQDSRERPERPIPSGSISRQAAFAAGWQLLAAGVALAWVASWLSGSVNSAVVGTCLALTIVMYDGGLKRTWAGPWGMGWCRLLCVLLGASAAADLSHRWEPWAYAVLVGAYTVGLTFLAQRETVGTAAFMARTRLSVTRLIQGFIVLDAIAATASAGWLSGLAVLALLVPTKLLARRTAMT